MEDQAKYELAQRPEAGALVEVEQQRAIAETQSAMIIAKRFPRDQKAAIDRIMNACTRPGLAEVAAYQYNRGGTDITGPSIRLSETIAQNWGNIQFGIRELDQKEGYSTVEAFAWDVETNVRQVKIFQVAHKRHTKKGSYALEDPRDIYEMVANQGARRLRACILGIIPGDVIEDAVKQCEATMKIKANVTPDRIAVLLERFGEFGVTKAQIEKRIQRHLDAITPALMVNLGKIYNSLKDGMSVPADWFGVPEQGQPGGTNDLTAAIKAQGKESAPGPEKPLEPPPNGDLGATSPPDAGKETEKGKRGPKPGSHRTAKADPDLFAQKDTDKAPMDPETENFLAEVIRYHDVIVETSWKLITDLFGMRGKDIKELAHLHVDHRPRFLDQCKRALDKQSE